MAHVLAGSVVRSLVSYLAEGLGRSCHPAVDNAFQITLIVRRLRVTPLPVQYAELDGLKHEVDDTCLASLSKINTPSRCGRLDQCVAFGRRVRGPD